MTRIPPPAPALHGVKILDLTSVVFGPYAAQILADYGADVIKVEAPEGDSTRSTGPAQEPGLAAVFLGFNRNKRGIVLDLKQAGARDALLTLASQADVLMHNIRPAKMAALGLDPDTVRARNPRLIYAALLGFGSGGAYEGQPAYDDIIQGLSGLADLMRRQTGEPRYLPTIAADKTCGLAAAHAILAALFQRERSGRGQYLEVPMYETMVSFVLAEHYYGRHLADAPDAGEPGYPRTLSAHRRPYATRDGHLCLMPYTDAHWQRFFTHAGRPDLAQDPRFASISARTRNIDALYALTGEIVAKHDTAHWLALCDTLQIPAARVNRLQDLDLDPHLRDVNFFPEIAGANGHKYRYVRNPARLQDSQVNIAMAPGLGEHTRQVLREAGLDEAAIERLLASGAARQADIPAADGH